MGSLVHLPWPSASGEHRREGTYKCARSLQVKADEGVEV